MQVYVTPRAERKFDSIVDSINQKWGEKTAKEFIQKLTKFSNFLSTTH